MVLGSPRTSPSTENGRNTLYKIRQAPGGLSQGEGWSQQKLAFESGIAQSYLGEVERSYKRNITLLNICLLSDTLEMTAAQSKTFD